MQHDDSLVDITRQFSDANPELDNGFAEHVPMGIDALLALGVGPALVARWAARHTPAFEPVDAPTRAVRSQIAAEVADGPWEMVLARHVGELVDRLDAHLFHGLIRTAHAVRRLEHGDDTLARVELAAGLAAWHVWAARPRRPNDVGAAASSSSAPLDDVLDAARRGAAAFVVRPSIVTLHAVTAPMAFLLVAPHVPDEVHARAAAAFAVTHRRHAAPADAPGSALDRPTATELDSLAEHWDAHPAKLVEAALRAYDATQDMVFLAAVNEVVRR